MKKLFTLVCGLAMALCANAATQISANFEGWGNCTVDGNTLTYPVAWDGAKVWLGGADWSDYEYMWVTFSESTCGIELDIEYGADEQVGKATTASAIAGSLVVGAQIDENNCDQIRQFYLKATTPGKLVVTGAYAGTEEEYKEALAGGKPKKSDLGLADLGCGWGEGTGYDAATKTITIGEDWTGKGWWIDGKDYSDFDKVVVKFAQPTATNGEIVVEYLPSGDNSTAIEEGATSVELPLGTNKNKVKQIYIKGPAGATFVLADAYVCVEDYTPTGIHGVSTTPVSENAPIYNLAGQQVAKSYKGIVIQNGKKYIQR